MTIPDRCYENLANAVVQQAASDYRWSRRYIGSHKVGDEFYKMAVHNLKDTENFLTSEWARILTNLDPLMILHKLQEESDGREKESCLS